MNNIVDGNLRNNQAEFWKNTSCSDKTASLNLTVEQSYECNSPLRVNFIKHEKAFDSTDIETLWDSSRKSKPY